MIIPLFILYKNKTKKSCFLTKLYLLFVYRSVVLFFVLVFVVDDVVVVVVALCLVFGG